MSVGSTHYVDSSRGADSGKGSRARPWRTLSYALAHVRSGATVLVRGGTYSGEVDIRNRRFSPADPVTVAAYPGERPLFVGDSRPALTGYPALHIFSDAGLRFSGLEVSNANGDGIQVRDSSDIELTGLFVHDNAAQGILVGGVTYGSAPTYSTNVQIWDSTFTRNGTSSGYAAKGDHSIYYGDGNGDGRQHGAVGGVIANNLIYGQATGRGIQLGQSARGTIVTNNTIYESSSTSPYAGQSIAIWNNGPRDFPTGDVIVVDNILARSSGAAIDGSCSSPMPSNLVDYNLTYGNARGAFIQYDGSCPLFRVGTHNTEDNPLFADPQRGDFRPLPTSPAVDAGDPAYTPPRDHDGRYRTAADLGAFASTGAAVDRG